ncbi:MAG: serine hydrolase [Alicyclobacillus sp.]|nr:serine hydrolase [Alicyclobacillus sp.]
MKNRFARIPKRAVRRTAALLALTVVGFSAPAAFAATTNANTANAPSLPQQVDATVQKLVSSSQFSGAVLVARRGQVLVDKGYGLANRQTNAPVTPDTRFAIGDLTEGFMAVATLQLVEQGKIGLDDPVSKYISSSNQAAQFITVRELLTHTSGAPTSPTGPSSLPGYTFQQSPLNYVLLGQVIQGASGESAEQYIQDHILTPLGLTNTGFVSTDIAAVPDSATGYTAANNVVSAVDFSPGNFLASDGMYSTVGDLYKWDQALYSSQLLPQGDLKQIFTPDPITVQTLKSQGFGFGWVVSLDGTVAAELSQVPGFASFVDRDMGRDTTVIVLSNEDWSPVQSLVGQIENTLSSTPLPYQPAGSIVGGKKRILADGKLLSQPFSRISAGTTFMPVWYVDNALKQVGVKPTWDINTRTFNLTLPAGTKADFSGISLGTGNTDIYVNGQLVKRINMYAWPDPATGNKSETTYAPIYYLDQVLSAAGIHYTWDGTTWGLTQK